MSFRSPARRISGMHEAETRKKNETQNGAHARFEPEALNSWIKGGFSRPPTSCHTSSAARMETKIVSPYVTL